MPCTPRLRNEENGGSNKTSMPIPQELVEHSYNAIADRYLQWTIGSQIRHRYLNRLIELLPRNGSFLDLGCGAGIPIAAALTKYGQVTGVDISEQQVTLARKNVSAGTFFRDDMATLTFPPETFDAVASFYAITHLPRCHHAELLGRIHSWLREGGFFLASLGAGDSPDVTVDDWLGAPMFFSHFDAATNRELIRDAGFTVIEEEIVQEDDDNARFLWVLAQKQDKAAISDECETGKT